jgi:CelD/BcsL family acetyltransferase involved in cellulose biosynthesis
MLMDNEILMQAGGRAVVSDGLHVLTTLAQMAEHKHLWRDLDLRSTADLVWFQSFDWCYNWIDRQTAKHEPYVLMAVENGAAVAVLPLMVGRNRFGARMLRMLGEPHTQYGNILTATGTLSAKQVQMLETALAVDNGCDGLVCNYVPAGSPLDQLMAATRRMTRLDNQSLIVDLSKFSNASVYDASLSKNTSKNLRRRRKHLEDTGALKFDVLRPLDAGYDAAVHDGFVMKQQWLAATGRLGLGLKHAGHEAFLKNIPRLTEVGDGPLAFVLSIAGKAVAIELGFLQRGHYYSYMGAFDWELRQQAPGRLQMHETICWLIGQGAVSLDLLANPTEYKRDVASRSISLASYSKSYTLRGHVYASFWTGWGKPQLKRTLAAIPQRWRTGFNQVKKLEFSN